MKLDVLGQSILIGAFILLWIFDRQIIWTNAMLIVLGVWQIASAVHLFLSYRYLQRGSFLKTLLVIGISTPVWINFVGIWAYAPIGGILLYYFFWSVRDLILVNRQPRSFWDL